MSEPDTEFVTETVRDIVPEKEYVGVLGCAEAVADTLRTSEKVGDSKVRVKVGIRVAVKLLSEMVRRFVVESDAVTVRCCCVDDEVAVTSKVIDGVSDAVDDADFVSVKDLVNDSKPVNDTEKDCVAQGDAVSGLRDMVTVGDSVTLEMVAVLATVSEVEFTGTVGVSDAESMVKVGSAVGEDEDVKDLVAVAIADEEGVYDTGTVKDGLNDLVMAAVSVARLLLMVRLRVFVTLLIDKVASSVTDSEGDSVGDGDCEPSDMDRSPVSVGESEKDELSLSTEDSVTVLDSDSVKVTAADNVGEADIVS